jgi:phosphate transport system substrate-binding protein
MSNSYRIYASHWPLMLLLLCCEPFSVFGQVNSGGIYKGWSDEKVKSELASLRKRAEEQYQDERAPAAWLKVKAAADALNATTEKWLEEHRLKTKELRKWQTHPDVLQFLALPNLYTTELQSLERELYLRNQRRGHEQTLSRHEALNEVRIGDVRQLKDLKLDVLSFPRIDGSTSTQPLAVLIACRCFDTPFKWVWKYEDFKRFEPQKQSSFSGMLDIDDGREKEEPEFRLFEYALRADSTNPVQDRLAAIINSLLVINASTHQSYLNLIEGKSDLGLIARRPSASELASAKAKGVELEVVPVALDALVFLVNQEQTVSELSTEQIKGVYQGKVKGWKELGGAGVAINAYQRPEDSGSQELMRELVMRGAELETPKVNLLGSVMSSVYLNLTVDNQGLAYSVHYYEQYMIGSGATKTIAIDGVAPSFESIQSRTYPHVSEVFVAIRKDAAVNAPARKMRDWLLSEEGQGVVRESGYVPILEKRE